MHAWVTVWSVASLVATLCLLGVLVDGGTVRQPIPGCPIATFSLAEEQCQLKLPMEGSLPPWLRVATLVEELQAVPTALLASFAKKQLCACEPPEVTAACSPGVAQVVSSLTAACRQANKTGETTGDAGTE